jgi:hypothetical protein
MNCPVTAQDLYRADAIIGKASSLKGKKKKMSSVIANVTLMPRVTQVEQSMKVDLFFVKGLIFLLAILQPLGLKMICYLKYKATTTVKKAHRSVVSLIKQNLETSMCRFFAATAREP